MKQRYNDLTYDLAWQAVSELFDGKWSRTDILAFAEEISGVPRQEIYLSQNTGDLTAKLEVVDNVTLYILDLAEAVLRGEQPDDVLPVTVRERMDGMTRKLRKIANLSIPHQLLGHLVKKGLEPLFNARILQTQHASIPKRGQQGLVRQAQRYLRKQSLHIKYVRKTDITNAYGSLQYSVLSDIIKKEIPSATWIHILLDYLGTLAPDGHLIIGGYLDAWLFNFGMSYIVREVYKCGYYRRGKFIPYVSRIVTFMDDFALFGTSRKGLEKVIPEFQRIARERLNLTLRPTSNAVRIYSIQDEHTHRHSDRPAERGCPNLDVGGYQVHRTYTTMRPRVAKRVIRAFIRGWEELKQTGTIRYIRTKSLSSRWGSLKHTNNYKFCEKYHVHEIMKIVRMVNSHHGRIAFIKRKEWRNYVTSVSPEQYYTSPRHRRSTCRRVEACTTH